MLDDCTFVMLPAELNEDRVAHSALSVNKGTQGEITLFVYLVKTCSALICFGKNLFNKSIKTCEKFDGTNLNKSTIRKNVATFSTEWTHTFGGLGLYNDKPTTVGCWDTKHYKTETLTSSGWTFLPDFPK